ncbi:MAG TPA: site-2 protease family protein [Patescibacteria group bacterium]|nr:site-2 protease family protein [Patescibacteria group bacterium]
MFNSLPFSTLVNIAVVIAILALSVAIHEAMHGFVAHKLGDDTAALEGRLTLNPLKHIDLLMTVLLPAVLLLIGSNPIFVAKPVPIDTRRLKYDEFGMAWVGLAGPLTNLALAVLGAIVARLAGVHLNISDGLIYASTAGLVFYTFISINVALFVFNMIPLPPLDGSRLLYAFAPDPVRRVMEQIEAVGFFIIIFVLLVLSSAILPIVRTVTESIVTFLLR